MLGNKIIEMLFIYITKEYPTMLTIYKYFVKQC